MDFQASADFARQCDASDPLRHYREMFYFPKKDEKNAIYLCGNSLGLQPKAVSVYIERELADWREQGVEGHFEARNPWFSYHHFLEEQLAAIVGASKEEVVAMNSLTTNLHLLMCSFYRPNGNRNKILIEKPVFPSDIYAVKSQIQMHDLDPDDCLETVQPREGEHLIREKDVLEKIAELGDELALVMIGGINYYNGQLFNMPAITKAAHDVGALAGFDLAHAVGNVPLALHDWDVDFAVWCSYKYLNSGPGGTGGAYVHERHGNNKDLFRLAGWWGNDEETRFEMSPDFIPQKGAGSWQLSNAPVLSMAAQRASLDLFHECGMEALRTKSLSLTAYLEFLLKDLNEQFDSPFEIITPSDPAQRGAQLSLLTRERDGEQMFKYITEKGVIADWRKPNVIRIAPAPMYNSYEDVYSFFEILKSYLSK